MKLAFSITLVAAVAALGATPPAMAATVDFTGTRFNIDAPGMAAPRCAGRATTDIRHDPPTTTATGTSNFGNFTPRLSHCISLPPSMTGPTPFDLGEFLFAFDSGDTLVGTYSGSLSPISAGLFSVTQTHLVTGGTGVFLGATGMFDSTGTLSFLQGAPRVTKTFAGRLDLPAVPEPATWAMMIAGFGLAGGAIRRRSPRAVIA